MMDCALTDAQTRNQVPMPQEKRKVMKLASRQESPFHYFFRLKTTLNESGNPKVYDNCSHGVL